MELRPVNKELKKKEVTQLVGDCYHQLGNAETVKFLDDLKDIGFRYASLSGLSIGIDDMKTPSSKKDLIEQARRQVFEVEQQYQDGVITNGERYNKVVDIWAHVTEEIADEMFRELESDEQQRGVQPDLHDGRLRRPGLEAADPAAGRHARAHGEAVRRDHRDADHVELPRGAHRARVLHLDARRPQGSGRHRAQDGRLRVPHPAAGGRGPGRHHQRAGLRDGEVDRRRRRWWRAARSSSRSRTASWAGWRRRTSATRSRTRSSCGRGSRSTRRSRAGSRTRGSSG